MHINDIPNLPKVEAIRRRLMAKSRKEGACWLWTGATTNFGYGVFQVQTRWTQYAHRVSYVLNIGPIPSGLMVCHRCDTPGCINPNCFFIGSSQANMTDKMKKGRHVVSFGEDNGQAILTAESVLLIRRDPRLQKLIAADFGISQQHVSDIKNGKKWGHL